MTPILLFGTVLAAAGVGAVAYDSVKATKAPAQTPNLPVLVPTPRPVLPTGTVNPTTGRIPARRTTWPSPLPVAIQNAAHATLISAIATADQLDAAARQIGKFTLTSDQKKLQTELTARALTLRLRTRRAKA